MSEREAWVAFAVATMRSGETHDDEPVYVQFAAVADAMLAEYRKRWPEATLEPSSINYSLGDVRRARAEGYQEGQLAMRARAVASAEHGTNSRDIVRRILMLEPDSEGT